jgi:hypothetical protein
VEQQPQYRHPHGLCSDRQQNFNSRVHAFDRTCPRVEFAGCPDLIATTPKGDFAVIECTTGLLKEESKLSLLYARTQTVRRALEASGHGHLRVLPIIVTSKSREDIKAEIEQAERHGIVVATREDLEDALTRTQIFLAADELYEQAIQAASAAQAKYEAQPTLPLPAP